MPLSPVPCRQLARRRGFARPVHAHQKCDLGRIAGAREPPSAVPSRIPRNCSFSSVAQLLRRLRWPDAGPDPAAPPGFRWWSGRRYRSSAAPFQGLPAPTSSTSRVSGTMSSIREEKDSRVRVTACFIRLKKPRFARLLRLGFRFVVLTSKQRCDHEPVQTSSLEHSPNARSAAHSPAREPHSNLQARQAGTCHASVFACKLQRSCGESPSGPCKKSCGVARMNGQGRKGEQ